MQKRKTDTSLLACTFLCMSCLAMPEPLRGPFIISAQVNPNKTVTFPIIKA
jgi:hypothetical protein